MGGSSVIHLTLIMFGSDEILYPPHPLHMKKNNLNPGRKIVIYTAYFVSLPFKIYTYFHKK